MNTVEKWKERVKKLKTEVYVIYLASKDPRVPWHTKTLIIFIVAYAFSPIDLIPDFIPVLGYLDDLIIIPLGIALALKLTPQDVLAKCREEALVMMVQDRPKNWWAGNIVILIWILGIAWIVTLVVPMVKS
ncbi:MAG: hypothetical protein DRI32_02595 [Chloroflexi bacterium]|nr:MAG: hypothetical protein DRI32_02595 [Chloroflexota bacterium]